MLDELREAVARNTTVVESAITLIRGLADKIADLQPDAEAIAALAVEVRTKADELAGAVEENTPS